MQAVLARCRSLLWLGVLAAACLGGAHEARAQQNNAFANGLTITNLSGTGARFRDFPNGAGNQLLNNFGATKQAGEPNHSGNVGGASVWFFWTPPASGPASFTVTPTNSINVTNLTAVYTGNAVNALTGVASNLFSGSYLPTVNFIATAGTLYALAVNGFFPRPFGPSDSSVQYSVAWNVTTNDNFTNATVLLGTTGSVNGDNTGATTETNGVTRVEPLHAGNPGGASVWYRWTAQANGPATFSLNSFAVSNLLAVYTGPNQTNLTVVTNAIGPSPAVTFTATAGTTYFVAVDGAQSSPGGPAYTGVFTLTYAGSISSDAGHFRFSTTSMTVAESESTTGAARFQNVGIGSDNRNIGGAVVTVVRTNGATGRMVVNYTTVDGTAVAGTDFFIGTNFSTGPITGSVTLDDYQMSTNFVITVLENRASTNDLTFQVLISSVVVDTNAVSGATESTNLTPTFNATPLTITVANTVDNIFTPNVPLGATNGMVTFTRAFWRFREFGTFADTNNVVNVEVAKLGGDPNGSVIVTYRLQGFGGATFGFFGQNNIFATAAGSDYATPSNKVPGSDPGPPDFDIGPAENHTVTIPSTGSAFIPITVFDDNVVELNEDILLTLMPTSSFTGITSPNPDVTTNGFGYGLGSLQNCIVTIVQEDIYNQEQPAGALDNTWNLANHRLTSPPNNSSPGANNVVFAVAVQPDQKTLLVGDFTAVNTATRNRIARLLPGTVFANGSIDFQAGQMDTTFTPGSGADNFINALALQPDGSIIIGGGFSSYTGVSRNGIARVTSTGSLDTSFDPGAGVNPGDTADKAIQSLALMPDGRVVAAGNFTTFNSQNFNRVVRLTASGAVDTAFNSLGVGPNDRVYAVVV